MHIQANVYNLSLLYTNGKLPLHTIIYLDFFHILLYFGDYLISVHIDMPFFLWLHSILLYKLV